MKHHVSDKEFMRMCKAQPNKPLSYSETMRYALLSLRDNLRNSVNPESDKRGALFLFNNLNEMDKASFSHIIKDIEYYVKYGKESPCS